MRLSEFVTRLQIKFPNYNKKAIYDTDKKGNEFCELIISNPHNDSLPLILTISNERWSIRLGITDICSGKCQEDGAHIDEIYENALNIIEDKVIIMQGYASEDDLDNEKLSHSTVFDLSLGETVLRAYNKTLSTLQAPLNPLTRIFAFYRGIFLFRTFTGKDDKTITRK